MAVLKIDSSNRDFIKLTLSIGTEVKVKKISARFKQAEVLLNSIDKILKTSRLEIDKIAAVEVNNKGESYTSLRIGVVTANALNYANCYLSFNKKGSDALINPEYSGPGVVTKGL